MNKKARFAALALAMACLLTALAGCGTKDTNRKIEGTYTLTHDNDYIKGAYVEDSLIAGAFYHNIGMSTMKNTVVFNTDGTYTYTKWFNFMFFGTDVSITYTGKYTDGSNDNAYILHKPTGCEWSIIPGMTLDAGWGLGEKKERDESYGMNWREDPVYGPMASKAYTGGMDDLIYLDDLDGCKPIDFFLSDTVSYNDTEGMADKDIFVEIQLTDGNAEPDKDGNVATGTFEYLKDNRVSDD